MLKNNKNFYNRYIGRSKNIRVIGGAASILLVALFALAVFPVAYKDNSAEATFVPATTTLSIVSSKNTASVDVTPVSSTGTFATSSAGNMAEFTVTTDNLTGYSVTLLGSDASGQLVNDTTGDTLDSITADTTENDFRTGSASTYNNKWGYRLNINNTTTTNFLSAPTSTTVAKTIYSTTGPNTTGTSDSFTLGLGARIDYTKPTGTYTNTFIITAIANNISYQINYLDSDTTTTLLPSDAESNISASSIELNSTAPTKSGYEFKGWCDGTLSSDGTSCTGTPGTTYQPGDTYTFTTLSSTTSNIANLYAMWKKGAGALQNWTGCSAMSVGDTVTLIDSRDNEQYLVGKLADGNCWTLENLRLDISDATVQTKLNSTTTNATDTSLGYLKNGGGSSPYPANGVIAKTASSGSWTNDYANPYIATQYEDTTQPASGLSPAGKIGIYYNFCAASAGSYCYAGNASSGNASQDICPAGWRMPTGGASGEYQALYTAYSSNVANFQASLSTPLSGYFYSGTAYHQGSYGYFWSSTRSNGNYMYTLRVYSSAVSPQNNDGRYNGFSVRCVLNIPTMQDFSASDAQAMGEGESTILKDVRDNNTYNVTKIGGNVWMTQNLRYQGDTVGSTSTATSWIMKSATSNISADTTMTMTDLTAGNSYDVARYHVPTSAQIPSGLTAEDIGVWYNYAAASAMTITGSSSNTSAQTYDVCPKGWRLPTNSEQSGITSYASAYAPVTGGYYYSGSLDDTGDDGYWWSSTSYNATNRYCLGWYGPSLHTGRSSRDNGFYVRCIRSS